MDIYLWSLLFLIIFMLHNLEEIITIERWFDKTYPQVRDRIPFFVQKELKNYMDITSAQFAIVVFVFSIFTSALIMIGALTQYDYLFLGVNFLFALNIFTHPLQALYLKCYTPGVITTLLLIIPYYSLFIYHFYNTDMFALDSVIGALVVMVILIPIFLLSHSIGEKWSKS